MEILKIKDKITGQWVNIPVLKGQDGYTPVKGVDYFTEEDKTEIINAIIGYFGGSPITGYVDENNNIIVTSNLEEGIYTVKYEMEDGSILDIGDLVLEEEIIIINQIPISIDTDGTIYNGIGYKINTRINSSGNAVEMAGVSVTGFIPVKTGDKIYMKGMYVNETSGYTRIAIYNASKGVVNINIYPASYVNEGNDIYSYTISDTGAAYVRLSAKKTMDGTEIITVNQPIV